MEEQKKKTMEETKKIPLKEKNCNVLVNKINLDEFETIGNLQIKGKETLIFQKGFFFEDTKSSLQNLRDEIEEASKHIKVCDKLKQRGKEIILSEDLCSVKDVETFLNKIDKAFKKHIGEL